MTGNAPQPGETPRTESNSWSGDPGAAFWRGDADREPEGAVAAESARHPHRGPATQSATLPPPTFTDPEKVPPGEAADALAAGRKDASTELAEPEAAPQPAKPATSRRTRKPADPARTDRDHLQLDAARFTPLSAYAEKAPESSTVPELPAAAAPPPERKAIPLPAKTPAAALPQAPAPVPPQPPAGLSRLAQAAQRPPSPLLETSTFWLTDEQRAERAATMPPDEIREKLIGPDGAAKRRHPSPRRPAAGLIALVALGLVAAFFAWVSAEPFWLAVRHGDSGVATVSQCTGDGVSQRCTGQFQAADGRYTVAKVTLLGVAPGQRNPGAISPARMVNPTSRHAYVGETGLLTHLRWLLGFVLVLLCGLGIAALTGARRLETARARRGALIMSLAGPLVLLAGFLYIAY